MYSNAIVIPAGHDRIDIHTNSIYTNNSGYTWNQGNGWATSQPSGNSFGSAKGGYGSYRNWW